MFAYNLGIGGAIISKFSPGCPRNDSGVKMRGHVLRPESWLFPFVEGPAGHVPLQADWPLGTGHTGAGIQFKDAIYTVVGTDGPARILHTIM